MNTTYIIIGIIVVVILTVGITYGVFQSQSAAQIDKLKSYHNAVWQENSPGLVYEIITSVDDKTQTISITGIQNKLSHASDVDYNIVERKNVQYNTEIFSNKLTIKNTTNNTTGKLWITEQEVQFAGKVVTLNWQDVELRTFFLRQTSISEKQLQSVNNVSAPVVDRIIRVNCMNRDTNGDCTIVESKKM